MKQTSKKYLTLSLVLAATALAGIWGIGWLQDVRQAYTYASQTKKIATASGMEKAGDFHKKIDRLRVFINTNSEHREDAEFYAIWRDKTKMAAAFIDYVEKRRDTLPHMECSTRSALMAAVLHAEGFKTRSIDAYHLARDNNRLGGHALLDVWNPHTATWETQDPDYDVYWKDSKSGKRTSMMLAGYDPNVIPCNARACGWSIESRENIKASSLKQYTDFLTVIDRNSNERVTFYSKEIDPDARFTYDGKTGAYCDLLKKNCRDGFLPSNTENIQRVMDQ